jgi:hypothetical protein
MKKIVLLFPLIVIALGLTTQKLIDDKMKNILKQLQISEEEANTIIFQVSAGPSYYFPNPRDLKKTASGDRAVIVETVFKYVKEYSSSKDFINKYNEMRESRKPEPPEKPKTMEELKVEQKKSLKEAIESMKSVKSQVSSDQQAMYDETIKMYEQQLREVDNPDNPMFNPEYDKIMQDMYKQQMADHDQRIKEWESEYPINSPSKMIKNWLLEFLNRTKDVDFNANTATDQYGRTVFVKQEYERKESVWKICFRAGKEATDAGRKYAQTWLNELK